VTSERIEVPCAGCSTDPCYHWPYCTELLSLRAANARLLALLQEVESCGHWSDCPASFNTKYRCRCAYGIIVEAHAQGDL